MSSGGAVLTDSAKEALNERQRNLLQFLYSIGPVDDETSLQALVFCAQKLGFLKTGYQFTFARNVPQSTDLVWDLHRLISRRMVRDTGGPHTLLVTDEGRCGTTKLTHPAVDRLSGMESPVVLSLARVFHLIEESSFENEDEIVETLVKREMVYRKYALEAVRIYRSEFLSFANG